MAHGWSRTNCKSMEQKTEAVCPRCKKLHYVYIFWTGTTMPRIYCDTCEAYAKSHSAAELYGPSNKQWHGGI